MKRIAFTILLMASCFGMAFAQGNLQFNQVRKLQWTQTTPGPTGYYSMGPYIVNVPAGKVLKIESMNVSLLRITNMGSLSNTFGDNLSPASIFLEETLVVSNPGGGSGTSPQDHKESTIIWLPAGDHNFYIGGVTYGGARTYSAMITAIEFNVVP